MRLSVLDQSPAIAGHEPAEAIAASLALARHCDALGYNRYWLSEHHNSGSIVGSIVGSAPEVLMAAVAATTHRIRIGLPYAFAYFFSDGHGVEQALDLYRSNYQPSERYPQPQATICVWALACDTEQEAARQLMTRAHWRVRFEQGLLGPLVSPEDAAAYPYSPAELDRIAQMRRSAIAGTAKQVAGTLRALAARLDLYELVVNTWAYERGVRLRSYSLLAEAFNLAEGLSRTAARPAQGAPERRANPGADRGAGDRAPGRPGPVARRLFLKPPGHCVSAGKGRPGRLGREVHPGADRRGSAGIG